LIKKKRPEGRLEALRGWAICAFFKNSVNSYLPNLLYAYLNNVSLVTTIISWTLVKKYIYA